MANFDYDNFRIENIRDQIDGEISFYQQTEYHSVYPIKDYLFYLKERIGANEPKFHTTRIYHNQNQPYEMKGLDRNEYVKKMDDMMFNKPWNKMREFHKIMKIKEYINQLEFGKKTSDEKINRNKQLLEKEIIQGFKDKRFTKNKNEIVYNQETMTIQSISCIVHKRKSGLYEIEWD